MVVNNIKDLLVKSLNKSNKSESVINSICFKTIIDTIKDEKNIDISDFLISVKTINNTLIITTNKPIINSELSQIDDIIIKKINYKIKNSGLKSNIKDIRYK